MLAFVLFIIIYGIVDIVVTRANRKYNEFFNNSKHNEK